MEMMAHYAGRVLGYLAKIAVAIVRYFKGYFFILLIFYGLLVYLVDIGITTQEKVTPLIFVSIWWVFFEMRTRKLSGEPMFKPTIRYIQHFASNAKAFWKGE